MPPKSGDSAPSKAGIHTSDDGSRVVPGSVRADGSVRREIKIRPGYTPREDVELYKTRTAEARKNRAKGGVPGADPVVGGALKENVSAVSNKNAKRREARKKKAAEDGKDEGQEDGGAVKEKQESTKEELPKESLPKEELKKEEIKKENQPDPEDQKAKEAKKLSKRYRQAKELSDRKENGEKLLPEQFEKVLRMNDLTRQLQNLGFGSDGEKSKAEGEESKAEG